MYISEFEAQYFTDPQITLIRAICVHQMDSLKRIIEGNMKCDDIDLAMYLLENEVEKTEFINSLENEVGKFQTLYNSPDDLRHLNEGELSMFRHLLANLENLWRDKYPNAVRNLWSRLHIIEETQKGNFKQGQLN